MIDPEALIGTWIGGRYRLTGYLGRGSFGWVFEASEELLGQYICRVAVKLAPPEDGARPERLLQEIRALAQLAHDHVIAYRACGQVVEGRLSGAIFLVTELGETSLDRVMHAPARLPEEELRAMAWGSASALAHLHRRGAVHRDVKPANIFRVEGRWKLADFGLVWPVGGARAEGADRQGTPAYMAPEALEGEISPAIDLYALGVTLLECLTDRLAHEGATEAEFIRNLRRRPARIPAGLPEPWKTILPRCLERDPRRRPTAEEVCRQLQATTGDCPYRDLPPDPVGEIGRFEGQADGVTGIVSSPDGCRALSGSQDKTVRRWDAESGRELLRFRGQTGEVIGVTFSPDGYRALSGSGHRTVRLWEVESGYELRRFEGHAGSVHSVAFSPDGRRALSGGMDNTLRLWEVESGRELHCFRGHEGGVYSVAFSPNGRRALSGSQDKTVRLWGLPG